MSKAREDIERIRKDKFWLDEKGELRERNPLIYDLTNALERLAEGLYSKATHFIFELIQNAEDNTYNDTEPSLSFQLVRDDPTSIPNADGALIIQNNEVGFSPDNVDAICAIGKSTKSKVQGYIGEKGIGFKSVFRITTIPHIFSNGYQFCFPEKDERTGLGYIVPLWVVIVPPEIDPRQTTIILPLDKPDVGYEDIKKMLQDIEPETILFLSKLKEIRIRTDSANDLTILKDDTKLPHIQLLLEGTKQDKSYSDVREFLLFTQTVDRPQGITHEKREGIYKRDISIAFPVDDSKGSMGKIFAYLPVRSGTGFPFLMNADFILPSSREDIQVNPWNRWLMECVASLLADKLPLLKESNLLTVELLETFAKRMNAIDEHNIFYPIVDAVRNALLDQELLPTDDGTFVSARNAKLARGADLRTLLTHDQLKELFQSDDDVKWLSGEITQDRTPDLRSYLISDLKVEEISPDGFAKKTTTKFLKDQSDDWMITFYKFLNDRQALWKKGISSWYQDGSLRNKSIIRLQDGAHILPFKENGSPNAYLPPENDTDFPVVSRKISKDEKALEFLKKLGLTKPDVVAEVIEHVLPKYRQSNSDISDDEHHHDIKKILRAYSIDSQTKKETLTEKLKNTAFIRATNNLLQKTKYKKPEQIYFKNEGLLLYFDGNKDICFISLEYDSSFQEMFKELGVADKVRIICKSENYSIGNVNLHSETYPYVYRRGIKGFDPDIKVDGLEYAVMNFSEKKSKFIWNKIAMKYSHCIKGKIIRCSRRDFSPNASTHEEKNVTSNFGNLLMNNPWLPDQQGDFHKPSELKLDDLPEVFDRDEKLASQLEMNDVVAELAEKVGIPADILQLVKDNPERTKQLLEEDAANKSNSEFPEKKPKDAERRKRKIQEGVCDAPKKKTETKERTVNTSKSEIDARSYLKNMYSNSDGVLICQLCHDRMPFKKSDGEYYMEAVEIADSFTKEIDYLYLAVCPNCAAKYKYFVKQDDDVQKHVIAEMRQLSSDSIPLILGEESVTLRFVNTHLRDIQASLEAMKDEEEADL